MATEVPTLTRSHTYLGEKHKALRSGHGIYVFENQFFRYEGEWVKGKKHGYGKLLLKDGTYYEGQFNHGEITGNGFKYFASTRCKYKGQFFKGELHGKGIMSYPDQSEYEGEFQHNRKTGYGIMRTQVTQYTGGFEQNLKHGQGCMIYGNGNRYEGYWVADKRHGTGTLFYADGSRYDGNFSFDEFDGQGILRHISGAVYNGIWNKGSPAMVAGKLKIVVDKSPMIIRQGLPFSITVQCLNDEDEVVPDEGRELRITAGFKYYKPSKGSALFDMIEDVEDKPIDTPFGYQVVPYPITNQEDEEGPPDDFDDELTASMSQIDVADEDVQNKDEEIKQSSDEGPVEGVTEEKDEAVDGEIQGEETDDPQNIGKESVPLPPPVPNSRTEEGVSTWNNLHLAPAPPMYRPFVAMEEAENESKKGPKQKAPGKAGHKNKAELEDGKNKVAYSKPLTALEKRMKQKEKALEEKYAKTGEYVLMVHDVTTPPFLGKTLEPDFLLLKLKRPEPVKRKEKETKRWDTSQHIKGSMIATERAEELTS